MATYTVQKAFEHFQPGDELVLNARQAKYLLMSKHIAPGETQAIASLQPIKQELELEPLPEQEQADETDASAVKKGKKA
jgi:hypothetical protein